MATLIRELNALINKVKYVERFDLYDKIDVGEIETRITEIREELEAMER